MKQATDVPTAIRPARAPLDGALARGSRDLIRRVDRFFFAPATALPFGVLRIGLTALLILQALSILPETTDFYGPLGLLQGPVASFAMGPLTRALPGIAWRDAIAHAIGLSAAGVLHGIVAVYLLSLAFSLAGFLTRAFLGVACVTHFILLGSGFIACYGADRFAQIALFYLFLAPSGDALSLDARSREGRWVLPPRPSARFWLRLLQIHLCIAYLSTALFKAVGAQWWNGEAVWRALVLTSESGHDFSWVARVPWLAVLVGWATLLIEGGYAFFISPARTRAFWIAATVLMHLGIAISLGLVSFSLTMALLTITAFGVHSGIPDRVD